MARRSFAGRQNVSLGTHAHGAYTQCAPTKNFRLKPTRPQACKPLGRTNIIIIITYIDRQDRQPGRQEDGLPGRQEDRHLFGLSRRDAAVAVAAATWATFQKSFKLCAQKRENYATTWIHDATYSQLTYTHTHRQTATEIETETEIGRKGESESEIQAETTFVGKVFRLGK